MHKRFVLRLTKEFDGFATVHAPVALQLHSGQMLHVEGDYAAGVERFLQHLSGTQASKRGTKFLNDWDVSDMGPESLHRLGYRYVTGRRKLLGSLTIIEQLRLRIKPNRQELKAAEQRIIGWISALDGMLNVPTANLSGGQQQLAMLCLASVGAVSVLIVDEPFMGIAPDIRPQVERLFAELRNEGVVMIVAEQRNSIEASTPDVRLKFSYA